MSDSPFMDPKPIKPTTWQTKPEEYGYGNSDIWGNNASVRGKQWMDTLVNMILEGPTKFLNRKKVAELYDASLLEEIREWQVKQWGDQKFTGEDGYLVDTLGTAHADQALDLMGTLFGQYGVTAGAGEAQSAGKDHIDWMLGNGGAGNFNHINSQWGGGNADWASVYEDMPLQGINKWNISDSTRYGNVNQDALPVEIFAEFFGRVNGVYGINGMDANFADYGKLFSGARSFVEGQLNKAKGLGGYEYAPSFYELALSKENNAGTHYKTQLTAGGPLVDGQTVRTGSTADDYNVLFSSQEDVLKLALTMLESRRRYWQATTLMMYSYRSLEASYNKELIEAAGNNADLLAKVNGFISQNTLATNGSHSARLGVDPVTIEWWDQLKNHQMFKEAGEFNKKFLQFIYSFQHHMVNTLEVFFNPTACLRGTDGTFTFDDDQNGTIDDTYGISHYFAYPFTGATESEEIESRAIINFNRYILTNLQDYQNIGPNSYQSTVCAGYVPSYNNSIKEFAEKYNEKKQKLNDGDITQEEYDNWKNAKLSGIMNLLNSLNNDFNFINTIKLKAWRKKITDSGFGILDNESNRNQLNADLDYAINFGGGLREFRSEFQLGRAVGTIDPYSGFAPAQLINFGINSSKSGFMRQPLTGDAQNWDMTQGFLRTGGNTCHSAHVANLFAQMSSGSIRGVNKNDLLLKGIYAENSANRFYTGFLIKNNDQINAIYDNVSYFGGASKHLYNTVGLFRMKADIMSYDRMLNIMSSSIANFNRTNKADYNRKIDDWRDRKEMHEMDQIIAEKTMQKAAQETARTMHLIKMAGQKQQQEQKKQGQSTIKVEKKREAKHDEFAKVFSKKEVAMKSSRGKESSKERASKSQGQKSGTQSKMAARKMIARNAQRKQRG